MSGGRWAKGKKLDLDNRKKFLTSILENGDESYKYDLFEIAKRVDVHSSHYTHKIIIMWGSMYVS
jgi:hypothetical protein